MRTLTLEPETISKTTSNNKKNPSQSQAKQDYHTSIVSDRAVARLVGNILSTENSDGSRILSNGLAPARNTGDEWITVKSKTNRKHTSEDAVTSTDTAKDDIIPKSKGAYQNARACPFKTLVSIKND